MFNHMSKISFSWLRERGREIFCGDDPWEWLVVWARSWLWLWLLTFSRTQIYCRHPSLGIRGPIYPPHSLPPHYLTSSTLICPPPLPHLISSLSSISPMFKILKTPSTWKKHKAPDGESRGLHTSTHAQQESSPMSGKGYEQFKYFGVSCMKCSFPINPCACLLVD